jgi:hypothetical protein
VYHTVPAGHVVYFSLSDNSTETDSYRTYLSFMISSPESKLNRSSSGEDQSLASRRRRASDILSHRAHVESWRFNEVPGVVFHSAFSSNSRGMFVRPRHSGLLPVYDASQPVQPEISWRLAFTICKPPIGAKTARTSLTKQPLIWFLVLPSPPTISTI